MPINPNMLSFSRQLRRNQTPWEKKLWMYLKGRKFYDLKFKRQVVIGLYIYDFVCFEKKLIIELDGSQHTEDKIIKKDEAKKQYAESLGYLVQRFANNDIENNLDGVLKKLRIMLKL